jgi:hypothetical protein
MEYPEHRKSKLLIVLSCLKQEKATDTYSTVSRVELKLGTPPSSRFLLPFSSLLHMISAPFNFGDMVKGWESAFRTCLSPD